MTIHLCGFTESQDSATLVPVAALADQVLTISGDQLRVPEFAPRIGAVYALGPNATRARLVAPSLRDMANFEIGGADVAAEPSSPQAILDLFENPLELAVDEDLQAEAAEDAAGASRVTVLVWLVDAPPSPVSGEIFTIRATDAATLVANQWSTGGALTFSDSLPVGRYAIVGMRAEAAGLQAARLNIRGQVARPGVIGHDAYSDLDYRMFRYGRLGVFGTFHTNTPPTVEYLSNSADTAETIWLDLVPA